MREKYRFSSSPPVSEKKMDFRPPSHQIFMPSLFFSLTDGRGRAEANLADLIFSPSLSFYILERRKVDLPLHKGKWDLLLLLQGGYSQRMVTLSRGKKTCLFPGKGTHVRPSRILWPERFPPIIFFQSTFRPSSFEKPKVKSF